MSNRIKNVPAIESTGTPPIGTHGLYRGRHAVTTDNASHGVVPLSILYPAKGQKRNTVGPLKDFMWFPAEPTVPVAALAPDVDAILHTLQRRYKPGEIVELRALGPTTDGKTVVHSGLYTDFQKLTEDVVHLGQDAGVTAIYTNLQLIRNDHRYLEMVNNNFATGRRCAGSSDIRWYVRLLIDVDPIRAYGLETCSSSDAEKMAAREVIDGVIAYFADLEIQGDLIDSGNGYHLLLGINLQATAENSIVIQNVLKNLAAKFDTCGAKIDTCVFDRRAFANCLAHRLVKELTPLSDLIGSVRLSARTRNLFLSRLKF